MSLIKSFISPLVMILFLLAIGMVLLQKKRENPAKWVIGITIFLFFLLSFRPFSTYLLWGLERHYPPLINAGDLHDVKYIVVLTAWDTSYPTIPYTSNLGYSSTARVLEAHRIYTMLPECKIIISGRPISIKLMAKLLKLLGVQRGNIIIDDHAENTWKSAINVKKIVSEQSFVLVTSAIHLPRAMNSFASQGLRPVPAPADFSFAYYRDYPMPVSRPLSYYIPNMRSFLDSDNALYEYVGLFWYRLRSYWTRNRLTMKWTSKEMAMNNR